VFSIETEIHCTTRYRAKGKATVPAGNVVVAKMNESFHELQQQQTAASDVNRVR